MAVAAAQVDCQIACLFGDATSAAQPARNAGHASFTGSSDQPGKASQETARYSAGSDAAGGATGGAGGTGAAGGGGGAGGVVTQADNSTAATSSGATPNPMRRERRIRSIMGWVVLEVLIALALAVGIVWWTMGFKSKKRPPGDGGAPH
jgi:cobalamin biosynthesis Mg chelatase CobN